MPTTVALPFDLEDLSEVPLTDAPLESVIAQVRFPREEMLAIRSTADSIRKLLEKYPIVDEERQQAIAIGPGGAVQQGPGDVLFRLQDKARKWHITIAAEFVALEAKQYVSRHDFCRRLGAVVDAVTKVIEPPTVYTRVGVRYTNRLVEGRLDRLADLVRPELTGVATMPPHGGGAIVHAVTDVMFGFPEEESHVRSRCALLPAGMTLDPTMPSLPSASWVLDIDAAIEAPDDFNAKTIEAAAERCARRAHMFFRWAVTDEFLAMHGGHT